MTLCICGHSSASHDILRDHWRECPCGGFALPNGEGESLPGCQCPTCIRIAEAALAPEERGERCRECGHRKVRHERREKRFMACRHNDRLTGWPDCECRRFVG